jgi:hypothetical protein
LANKKSRWGSGSDRYHVGFGFTTLWLHNLCPWKCNVTELQCYVGPPYYFLQEYYFSYSV